MQPKVPRYQLGQIDVLKNKLSLPVYKDRKMPFKISGNALIQTQMGGTFYSNTRNSSVKASQRRTSTPMTINEIDEFEKRNSFNCSPVEKRWIYSMD
jgi:hypothetical protein